MKGRAIRKVLFAIVACLAAASNVCGEGAPKAISLPGDRVFPAGVASGPDGTLYIGSAGTGGILRALPGAARAEPWILPGTFESHSIFGIFVDVRSQTLWVCSNELSGQTARGVPTATSSALIGFDLKNGQGKVKASLPSPALCNGIAVAHDGSIYVTNGAAPQILRYNEQAKKLDVWLTDPQFQPKQGVGLDGIAVSTTNGTVYVDTVAEGKFFQIPVAHGKPTSVTPMSLASEMDPGSRALTSPGALHSIYGDAFLLIEGAGRLDRITIEGSAAIIYTIRGGLPTPSGFAQTDGTTWIAEGQLPCLFDAARKSCKPSLPFRLLAVDY